MKKIDNTVAKTASFTVLASDSGKTFILNAADLVASLPATEAGLVFTFITGTVSAGTGTSVSPVAADKILGAGLTEADNKDIINSGASDVRGDLITLQGDGVDGYWVTRKIGTWAREA